MSQAISAYPGPEFVPLPKKTSALLPRERKIILPMGFELPRIPEEYRILKLKPDGTFIGFGVSPPFVLAEMIPAEDDMNDALEKTVARFQHLGPEVSQLAIYLPNDAASLVMSNRAVDSKVMEKRKQDAERMQQIENNRFYNEVLSPELKKVVRYTSPNVWYVDKADLRQLEGCGHIETAGMLEMAQAGAILFLESLIREITLCRSADFFYAHAEHQLDLAKLVNASKVPETAKTRRAREELSTVQFWFVFENKDPSRPFFKRPLSEMCAFAQAEDLGDRVLYLANICARSNSPRGVGKTLYKDGVEAWARDHGYKTIRLAPLNDAVREVYRRAPFHFVDEADPMFMSKSLEAGLSDMSSLSLAVGPVAARGGAGSGEEERPVPLSTPRTPARARRLEVFKPDAGRKLVFKETTASPRRLRSGRLRQ